MSTKHQFQTEINQLLDLMINSLYSNKEIFLRELISNASDAIDKLSYLKLTDKALANLEFDPKITISFDESKHKLTISDNGIGMDEEDIINNLGTIARSGTKNFIENLKNSKNSNLIGQFGVGFYSIFMVADKVVVNTKKYNSKSGYSFISDGKSGYEITQCAKDSIGTEITLFLKDEDKNFASRYEIQNVVKKYSSHIAYKIFLEYDTEVESGEGEDKKKTIEHKIDQINTAKALWTLPKSEIKKEEYEEFYKAISNDYEAPLKWIHNKVEGSLEYTTLFYIPSKAPFDLYRVDYASGVKLYVKRVFITDNDKELLPQYLRFVRGIIDSEDLPLNVSREILQQNKILANIKSASTKKILEMIASIEEDKYEGFYSQFGKVLKEGLMDYENKEKILDLLRFYSVKKGKLISLKEYKENMSEGQSEIFYLLGSNLDTLKASPLLEVFTAKNQDVLLLSDEVDSFIAPMLGEYSGTKFADITTSASATQIDEATKKEFEPFIATATEILKDKVKEIKLSNKLVNAPACVVADESNIALERLMAQMGQTMPAGEKLAVLEINPNNALIKKLSKLDKEAAKMGVNMVFDAAKLLEGSNLSDVKGFVENIYNLLDQNIK